MVFLVTAACMIAAACACAMSYIAVNKRLEVGAAPSAQADGLGADASEPSGSSGRTGAVSPADSGRGPGFIVQLKRGFSVSPVPRWSVFAAAVLLTGVVCFCAQIFQWGGSGIDTIGFIKVAVTALIMMSAAVIDLFTKKIPSFLPILFLIAGTIMLAVEFIYMRESFLILLAGSLVGLVGGFLVLLLLSFITKGGLGMGDVKLVAAMGYLSGIAASFYSFFFATVLCLIVTLVLLISKRKKLKDELPFGPFLYLGYVLAIILGKF
ncbi:MAG TPA: prepilin peptidase [Candidatus Onthovicinus excrementipullorum]|nr:prepilin peptidase [Candidatus Onthovicinus excrementipullorum]